MVTLQLLDLPNELLIIIFSNLPVRSVLACGASCLHLCAVITQSKLLQWQVWSTQHGIQGLFPLALSPHYDRIVWQWELDWFRFKVGDEADTSKLQRQSQGEPPHRESPFLIKNNFLMRSGYLIQMHQNENPGWSHLSLRESCKSIQDPVWTDVRLGDHLAMEGWALDLDQDLVAASLLSTGLSSGRLEIHLIHFTTGKRHDAANIPAVLLGFEGKYDKSFGTRIEIMGNYVVILLAHGTLWRKYQTLYLVDWIKGRVIYRQRSSANTYFPVLTSISEDTFVLGLKSDWALALCRITKEGDALNFRTICKLKLPDVKRHTSVQLESFDRAPSGPDNPFSPNRHSTLPFRSSPSESVLSFYVRVDRGWSWSCVPVILFFYIRPSDLRTLAESAVRVPVSKERGVYHRPAHCHSPSPKTLPITVPWQNWGPKMTRWIKPEKRSTRQSLCGARCAISTSVGLTTKVQLLDFNLSRIRKIKNGVEKNPTGLEEQFSVVDSQSTISARKYFRHDIVSHLPYFERRRSGAEGRLLIDDQWVVQIRQNDSWRSMVSDQETYASDPHGHTIWLHSVSKDKSEKAR